MRGFIIALLVCAPAVASADVELKGWTADGKAVVEIKDPMSTWTTSWVGQDTERGDFWAVCGPEAPGADTADGEGGQSCTVCKDASSCGLATDASDTKSSMKSPNKKVKVTDKRKCKRDVNMPDGKACLRTISFGKKGKQVYEENSSKDKAKLGVFWRPDSGVALLTFETMGGEDGSVDMPAMYVVDLGGGLVSGGGAQNGIGYAFSLDGKSTHDDGGNNTGGSAKVMLAETLGGKTSKLKVEDLKLYSEDSQLGLGEAIVFGGDMTPSLQIDGKADPDDFSSDLAAAVKSHLPQGTIAAAGWVNDGDHHSFSFVVYALVPDGGSVKVMKQDWSSDGTAPQDEAKLNVSM
jgi:hypothetical protein